MAWECAECGEKEPQGIILPGCHHCGRPVCGRHRRLIDDAAFSTSATRVAVHCLGCWRAFHPEAPDVDLGAPSARGRTVA